MKRIVRTLFSSIVSPHPIGFCPEVASVYGVPGSPGPPKLLHFQYIQCNNFGGLLGMLQNFPPAVFTDILLKNNRGILFMTVKFLRKRNIIEYHETGTYAS